MKHIIRFFIVTILVLPAIPQLIARADAGPKPYITVYCHNLPEGVSEIYLDLLIDEPPLEEGYGFRFGSMDQNYDPGNYYDGELLDILRNYNVGGWRPALVTGTSLPLWAELRHVVKNGEAVSGFDYFGVPDRFKVIVVTENGDVAVSNVIERKAFGCVVDFDYADQSVASTNLEAPDYPDDDRRYGEAAASERNPVLHTIIQLSFTLSSTYIIEGIILLLFRFSLRRNWKPFVFVNLGTQLALNVFVAIIKYFNGTGAAILACFVAEIVILIVEMVLYSFLLKQHSKLRRAFYAITANIASFLFGFVLMNIVFIV